MHSPDKCSGTINSLGLAPAGFALLAVAACNQSASEPAANRAVVTESRDRSHAQPPVQRAPEPRSQPIIQEPQLPAPDPVTKTPAKTPAAPPDRVILPSPVQPPAEVDPPHVDPGNEVPR